MKLEFRTHHDHGPARIVHALSEQVLTEPALFALEHVRKRLQRALIGTRDDAAAPAVIEQRVDRFLQHALLVPDDDVRCAKLDEPLEAVIFFDDPAAGDLQNLGLETTAAEGDETGDVPRAHPQDPHYQP